MYGSIDDQRLDYTGYGPTGAGGAPTAGQMRRQSMNRFHSNRVTDAMQYIDPYVTGVGVAAQQLLSKSNDPAAARRGLYSTAGGQAALDGLMMKRQAGLLGQGNPVNYANNVVRGITSGGFTADITGNGQMGLGQRVSGNGMLAERVSMNYAKGLMTDLYGKGTPDPSKLHGFDMEEASGVFATIASRGGVGKAASWKRNADLQTRIDAARDAAVHPQVQEMLSKTTASTDTEMEAIIAAQKDPKLKKELERVHKSTDAIVVNSEGRRAVAETVREVTKGMAALSDMYGELTAPELQQQLESITGKRITNRAQAKAATAMVDNLRGAADMSGIDPRAFMDYAQSRQAGMQQQVAAATGLDERSSSLIKEITAQVANTTLIDAASAAKVSSQNAADAKAAGFGDLSVRTVDEIALDKEQGRMQFMEKYAGVTMARGGLENLSGANRKQAEALLKKFDSTTDPGERSALEDEAKALMGKAIGGDAGWYGAKNSGVGAEAMVDAYRGNNALAQERAALEGRTEAINTSGMEEFLTGNGMDADAAKNVSNKLLRNVGVTGMLSMAELDRSSVLSPEGKRRMKIEQLMKEGGMTEEEAGKFLDQSAGMDTKKMMNMLSATDREGVAKFDTNRRAQFALDSMGGDTRTRIRDEDGKVTMNSIATALSRGKVDSIDDPESMALALQAMAEEGMSTEVDQLDADGRTSVDADGKTKKIKMSDHVKTGMDMSKGMTPEVMKQLQELNGGKDLGLAKKLGYASDEEMAKATANDKQAKLAAINMLKTDEGFMKLNISGNETSMSGITDEALQTGLQGQFAQKRLNALATANSLFPTMSKDEQNSMTKSIEDGKEIDLSLFQAGSFNGKVEDPSRLWNWRGDGDDGSGRKYARIDNSHRMNVLAGTVQGANDQQMAGLAEINKGGGLVKQMEAQAATWRAAMEKGATTAVSKGDDGKDVTTELSEDFIKKFEASISKLREGTATANGTVAEMRVTNLHVDNIPDNKK